MFDQMLFKKILRGSQRQPNESFSKIKDYFLDNIFSLLMPINSGPVYHMSWWTTFTTFKLGTILKRDFDVLPRHHDFDIHSRSYLLLTICGIQKVDLALAQNF